MTNNISPEAARATLDAAATASGKVRAHGRWMSTYLGVYAAGWAALTLILGLVDNVPVRVTVACVGWVALVTGMVLWSRAQPALVKGTGLRTLPYWAATTLLYAAAMFIGLDRYQGNAAFWIPAAILVALPLAIGAVRERRA